MYLLLQFCNVDASRGYFFFIENVASYWQKLQLKVTVSVDLNFCFSFTNISNVFFSRQFNEQRNYSTYDTGSFCLPQWRQQDNRAITDNGIHLLSCRDFNHSELNAK